MKSNYKRTPWTFKYNGKVITSESEWMDFWFGASFLLKYKSEDHEVAMTIFRCVAGTHDFVFLEETASNLGYNILLERHPERTLVIGTLQQQTRRQSFWSPSFGTPWPMSNVSIEYTPPSPSVFQRFTRWVSSWTT